VIYFWVEHPDQRTTKLYKDLPDKITEAFVVHTSFEEQVWQLFFDGASRLGPRENIVVGVGVVLVSPHNYMIPHTFSLAKPCFNNVEE